MTKPPLCRFVAGRDGVWKRPLVAVLGMEPNQGLNGFPCTVITSREYEQVGLFEEAG